LPTLRQMLRNRWPTLGRISTRRKLIVNVVSLYALQGCTYLLPLVTIPYVGRVLGPGGWGAVLFSQAIGSLIAMGVEYGFDFSATREVARCSQDKNRLRELVTGVTTGLDITGRLVATISIFVLVHRPEDGWKIMLAQAIGCAVSHAITVGMAGYEIGFCRPSFALTWSVLRLGWPMFLFRASMTVVSSANGLILGFFASPAAVGLFGSADKFRQVAFQALWPVNQTLFPHQSERVKRDPRDGLRTVRKSLLFLGGLGVLLGIALTAGAPFLVNLVLGPAFQAAVPVLRVFGFLIPLQAICTVVSTQWMLPLGLDRQVSFIVLTAGIVNAAAGIALSMRSGAVGMAIAVTLAQLYTAFAFEIALRQKGLSPLFRLGPIAPPPSAELSEL
jgi:PST family polysaccharide transporter